VELVENHAEELSPENLRRLRYYNRCPIADQQLPACIDSLMPWLAYFQECTSSFRMGFTDRPQEAWQALEAAFPCSISN